MLSPSPRRTREQFEREALVHLDALYGLATRLTRDERDAEDLVQDTLLRAFRFFDRFEEGTHCKAWLFKILHNNFINKYRKRARDREIAAALSPAEGAGATVSHGAADAARDPERAILEGVLSQDVQRALDSLPDEFRAAVILSDLEELSYREIADVMECPIGTVMSRLYRGRRLLQQALRGYAVEQGLVRDEAADVIPFPGKKS